MKSSRARRRRAAGAPGVKLLLTASALAATLGGWAVLAAGEHNAAMAAPPAVVEMISPTQGVIGSAPQIQPPLRVVTAPPVSVGPSNPITVTRSSR